MKTIKTILSLIGLLTVLVFLLGFNVTKVWIRSYSYEYEDYTCYTTNYLLNNRFLSNINGWSAKYIDCYEFQNNCNIYNNIEVYDYWFYTKRCEN